MLWYGTLKVGSRRYLSGVDINRKFSSIPHQVGIARMVFNNTSTQNNPTRRITAKGKM
jgi:hypothetical protein